MGGAQGVSDGHPTSRFLSLGWYRRSPDERQEWFRRIHGEQRASSGEAVGPHAPAKKADKTDECDWEARQGLRHLVIGSLNHCSIDSM